MMPVDIFMVAIILPILGLGLLTLGRRASPQTFTSRSSVRLAAAGLLPLVLETLFWCVLLTLYIDWQGWDHSVWLIMLSAASIPLLGFLAWRRPVQGGAAALLRALVVLVLVSTQPQGGLMLWVMALPSFLTGILFLLSGLTDRSLRHSRYISRSDRAA